MRLVYPNGLVTISRPIPGVGTPRYRYPIMPLHHEGTSEYRALEAMKELVLKPEQNMKIFQEMILSPKRDQWFKIGTAEDHPELGLGPHTHLFKLTPANWELLEEGRTIKISTTITLGHAHVLTIEKRRNPPHFHVFKIDNLLKSSIDKHGFEVQEI